MSTATIDNNGNIELTAEDRKAIGKLNRGKTLSTIFAAVAAAGAAAAAIYTLAQPVEVVNFLRGLSAVMNNTAFKPAQSVNTVQTLIAFVVPSLVASLYLGMAGGSSARVAADRVRGIDGRQFQAAAGLRAAFLREAQEKAIAGLREKTARGEALSDADYDVLALLPQDLQAQAPEQASLAKVLEAKKAFGTLEAGDYLAAQAKDKQTPAPKDYTNTFLFLPALLTWTMPALMLLTAVKMKNYAAEDFQLPAPGKPDLYAVAAAMKQKPA